MRARPRAIAVSARRLRLAHEGRKDPRRELLYQALFSIWLDGFHERDLGYSREKDVGQNKRAPTGSLVRFLRAAFKLTTPNDAPADETHVAAIKREKRRRRLL